MDAIATKERAWVMRWGMSHLRVGITPKPAQDGSAVDNEVTGTDQARANGDLDRQDKQRLPTGAPTARSRFHCWEGEGIRG